MGIKKQKNSNLDVINHIIKAFNLIETSKFPMLYRFQIDTFLYIFF